jgi:hypothetical protein
MYCRYCGKEIGEEEQFCQYCGREQVPPLGSELTAKGRKLTRLKVPGETKNPGAAASLGFFLGWIFLGPVGYIYLEQWNWFWLTFVIQLFAVPLTLGLAYLVIPIVLAFHQYQMAKQINELVITRRSRDEEEEGPGEEDRIEVERKGEI